MPRLDQDSIKKFNEEGYLVAENLLDEKRDIQPLVDEYASQLDILARQCVSQGKLSSHHFNLPFGERLTQILGELGENYIYNFEITLPFAKITENTPIHLGPAVFNLMRSPRMLDAVESLIGPEIYCNPAHHVRMKLPTKKSTGETNDLTGTVHCHQDQGGTLPEADNSNIITVWIAINDATIANGCLMVIPRSHQKGLLPHVRMIKGGKHAGTAVREDLLDKKNLMPLPIKRGGVIFMSAQTIHGSLINESDGIRWSADFRYQPIGRPTGRPMFPGFVARSQEHPEKELKDHRMWAEMWLNTRAKLANKQMPVFHRWSGDSLQIID